MLPLRPLFPAPRRRAFQSTARGPVRRIVEEVEDTSLSVPLFRHPGWRERFPWLVQGTTGQGEANRFDLGSFGDSPISDVLDRWLELRQATGTRTVVHSRQVHGTEIGIWNDPLPEGLLFVEGLDGHITERVGLLLAASIADCVPISIVAPQSKRLAMVHAGWRGVAGGALEEAVSLLAGQGADVSDLWVHFGPSICGRCYEVGPEVHRAVNPEDPAPTEPEPIDLREALAGRAEDAGVPANQISISAHCTLCGPGHFFSHRRGDPGRQMGVLGRVA